MRAVWAAGLLACVLGCRMLGAETHYGVSGNDLNFGEVNLVLEDEDGSRVQGVPFLLVGQGQLPAEYEGGSFDRFSLGQKLRLPFRIGAGRVLLYVEGGAMVSYYQAEAISTPFELEMLGGGGVMVDLGDGWSLDLGARVRHPAGNGNDHDEPTHAPHATEPEFILGVRKDF